MSVVLPIEVDDRFRIITASAAQTVLAIGFPWQSDSDIALFKMDANGDWLELSVPADYTLSGAGNPSGGSATLAAPATLNDKYLALGAAVLDRLSSIVRQGRFSSKTTDDELDRNRIVQQEHARDLKRALKADYGQSGLTVGPISDGALLMRDGGRIVDGPDGQAIIDAEANALAAEAARAAAAISQAASEQWAIAAAQSAAQLSNYLSAPIKLSSYVNSDGTNEDAGFANFLTALKSGSRSFDGLVNVEVRLAQAHTLTNYTGALGCAGEGALVFTGGTDGLTIDNSALPATVMSTLRVYGVPLRTTAVNLGVGLRVLGSEPNGDQLVPQLHMMFPRCEGTTINSGWRIGFELEMIKSAKIEFPIFRGRVPPLEANGFSDLSKSGFQAMYFHNGCNEVEVSYPRLDWGQYGVYVGREPGDQMTEGVVVRGGMVRAMRFGFVADPSAGEQFQSLGVHYDTTLVGISFGKDVEESTYFSFANGNFFLRSRAEGYVGAYTAIAMNNSYMQVYNNTARVAGDSGAAGRFSWSDSTGIRIGSDTDLDKKGRGRVDGNILNGFNVCLHLLNSTENMRGQNTCNPEGNVGQVEMLDTGTRNLLQYKAFAVSQGHLTAAALNVTGDGTEATIAGYTVTLNEAGGLSGSGAFTAPVTGHYLVEVNVGYAESGSASREGEIKIYANGVQHIFACNPVSGYGSAVGTFFLEAGQTIVGATIVRGTTKTVDLVGGGANGTRIKVTLLRAK